jgi:prepilin-type N-terminal cleavage/methylation domain-containing protein
MKKNAGFSLMELMVVLAILAILIATSTPNVFRWVSTQKLNSAVRDVRASIEYMRLFAVKENAIATITFSADSYETDKWKRGQGNLASDHDTENHSLPGGITLTSTSDEIIFNSRGMAIDASGDPIVEQTITITNAAGQSLQIFVNTTGNCRIG